MVYDPTKDFLALWRNVAGQVSKVEMPGLDYVVAALARAGFITLSVSATAPVVNQSVTAWLQTAVPSNSAEGTMHLWDPAAAAYAAATPALFFKMLETASGQNGVSWYTTTGGPPVNTVGLNGDFAVQTDEPGGIFGPKVAGAWPANPLPGTTDIIGSEQLDLTFGTAEGLMIYRGPAVWQALAIGGPGLVMASSGVVPQWETLSALFDVIFSNVQGSILYRDAVLWNDLPPGAATQVLTSNGPAANPQWSPRTAEFPSGTIMLFQQTAAPPGWTKQTALNDAGLRVTSGAAGTTSGSPFSTVFAQTTVGNHTLTTTEMPSHNHPLVGAANLLQSTAGAVIAGGGFGGPATVTVGNTGGDGPHAHSINLTLSYVDVIIASKN